MKDKLTLRSKAKIVLLALTLLTFGRAQAQVSFHLGGLVGPQFTNLKSDYGTYTGVLGYYAGATTELRFGKYFSTQLDILYSVQGAERIYADSFYLQGYYTQYNNYASTDMLSYVQPHLLFKLNIPLVGERIMPYDLPEDNPSSLSFFAGPYFGYLLGFSRNGSVTSTYVKDSFPVRAHLSGLSFERCQR